MGKMRGEFEMPKGLSYYSHFLNEEEEKYILNFVKNLTFLNYEMHGKVARRKVVHFGYDYNFEKKSALPGIPFPEEIIYLRNKVEKFLHLEEGKLEQCLISYYPPKATIGWHKDVMVFGSKVIGLSLLNECLMRFQKKDNEVRKVYEMRLDPGSLYVLDGESRYKWEHSIPPLKDERYSITFRTIRKK